MALVVNHNLMAMNTARNLQFNYNRLAKSIQRLSSGLRINQAADDAAGLAITELMRADVAAINQGIRNANDAISLIQTFDGALSVIDEKLVRMKELAEQAATGTYTTAQRALIDSEYAEMYREVTRIANATDFNGIHLIASSAYLYSASLQYFGNVSVTDSAQVTAGLKIHFGPDNSSMEDYYYLRGADMTASGLGLYEVRHISTQSLAQQALELITSAINTKAAFRAFLGAMQNRLESTIANLSIQLENLQAAESRIRDIDVAWEMTEFTRNLILTQAGVAMLAQANSLPQLALQLLSV